MVIPPNTEHHISPIFFPTSEEMYAVRASSLPQLSSATQIRGRVPTLEHAHGEYARKGAATPPDVQREAAAKPSVRRLLARLYLEVGAGAAVGWPLPLTSDVHVCAAAQAGGLDQLLPWTTCGGEPPQVTERPASCVARARREGAARDMEETRRELAKGNKGQFLRRESAILPFNFILELILGSYIYIKVSGAHILGSNPQLKFFYIVFLFYNHLIYLNGWL